MIEQLLELGLRPGVVLAVGLIVGAVVRALQPRFPKGALPWLALGMGTLAGLSSEAMNGFTPGGLVRGAAEGLLGGALAIAGKDSLKPLAKMMLGEGAAAAIFGSTKAIAKKVGKILIVLLLSGCASVLPALMKVAQGAQLVSSLVDAAEVGSRAYFDRHPSLENERQVQTEVRRTRLAIAALDAATAAATSADAGELDVTRKRTLESYARLRELLADLGILDATPPSGGAETNAPEPEPLELLTAGELGGLV